MPAAPAAQNAAPIPSDIAAVQPALDYRPIDALVPYDKNARTHPAKQIAALAESITKLGFGTAIAVWRDNMILAGHGRVEAAKVVGLTQIPCLDLSHLTFDQARAFILADNKISDMAGFDNAILASELAALNTDDDLGFDLQMLGFTGRELLAAIPDYKLPAGAPAPRVQGSNDKEIAAKVADVPVAALGQIWALGDHVLMCGDSTSKENWARIMGDDRAALLFTDPPYGVSYSEKNEALNKLNSGTKNVSKIENDKLSHEELAVFLRAAFDGVRSVMADRASFYVCCPPSDLQYEFMVAMTAADLPLRQRLLWNKNRIVLSRADYHYKHELIYFGSVGGAPHYYGPANETSVWDCPLPMSNGLHPTMKPIALIERALRNSTMPGDIVIDGFGGSGSTLIACERRARRARLIELSPEYCDIILRRWRNMTGQEPVLTADTSGATDHPDMTLAQIEALQGYVCADAPDFDAAAAPALSPSMPADFADMMPIAQGGAA